MVKVWDGFIRFFHWSTVALIAALYFSAEEGYMEVHMVCAYTLMALLLTRLIWGFIGSDTARIKALLHKPKSAHNALNKPISTHVGHNPAGSYMVLLFFVLLIAQLTSGLFTSDEVLTDGPLVEHASDELISAMSQWHDINFNLLLGAIVLHIVAIAWYRIKGKNLVKAMITGNCEHREVEQGQFKPAIIAFAIFAVLLLVIFTTWGMEPLSSVFDF